MNDSSTGGPLIPAASPAPVEDDDFMRVLSPWVRSLTSLAESMVRPRWQPNPPKMPDNGVNWCAIGEVNSERDAGPAFEHIDTIDGGEDKSYRHEDVHVLASFYGANGKKFAALFVDGAYIPQNAPPGMKFIDAGDIIPAHELINNQWYRRWDVHIKLRRLVVRRYPIRNLTGADIDLITDIGITNRVTVRAS